MSSGIPGPSESSSSHRYAAARVFYMDSLRAVLMSLGVALHAAMVYDTSREWVISDPSGSPAFGIVIALIHLFRMPVFFLVAGYFTYLVFTRYTLSKFVFTRFLRIVLPFLATLFTANLGLQWYFAETGLRSFTAAHWVGQLWFLAYLFLYVAFFTLFLTYRDWMRFPIAGLERACAGKLLWPGLYVLFIGAFVLVRLVIKAFNLWETTILGFINVPELLQYQVYFVAGLILSQSETFYETVTRPGKIVLVLAIACTAVVLGSRQLAPLTRQWNHWSTLAELSTTFFGAAIILGFCKRMLNFDNGLTRFFSDASYSIYLFHGPFLIAFAFVLLPLNVPGIVKYFLLVAMCLVCTLALHALLIARVPLLALLFNGKLGKSHYQRRFVDHV